MTMETFFTIALLLLVLVAVFVVRERAKDKKKRQVQRQAEAQQQAQQQAKQAEEAERVLSALLTVTEISYTLNVGDFPLNLTAGERALVVLPRTTLFELTTVRKTSGSWGGPTIRIYKGIYYRMGTSQRTGESHTELRKADEGALVITSERFAFMGNVSTISVRLSKIIGVSVYADAVGLHFEGKDKPTYFQPSSVVTLTYTINDKVHKMTANPVFLKTAIDVARRGGVPRLEHSDGAPSVSNKSP